MYCDDMKLQKDVVVGDFTHLYEYKAIGRCIANNGKTLKFEVLYPNKELQIKYGRPVDANGKLSRWGNWRLDIPFAGNEDKFRTFDKIVNRRISKKGYSMTAVTADKIVFVQLADDPHAN